MSSYFEFSANDEHRPVLPSLSLVVDVEIWAALGERERTMDVGSLSTPVEPETMSDTDLTQGSLDNNDQMSGVKPRIEDIVEGVNKSFSASVEMGENALRNSVETVTSSISSAVQRVNESLENAVYIAIEGVEESLGLDPNTDVIPFVLFIGTTATL